MQGTLPTKNLRKNTDGLLFAWPPGGQPFCVLSVRGRWLSRSADVPAHLMTSSHALKVSPRYDGINIIVNIRYEMVGILGQTLQYTYEPRKLSNLEFKIEEAVYSNGGATRVIYNRHGVGEYARRSAAYLNGGMPAEMALMRCERAPTPLFWVRARAKQRIGAPVGTGGTR